MSAPSPHQVTLEASIPHSRNHPKCIAKASSPRLLSGSSMCAVSPLTCLYICLILLMPTVWVCPRTAPDNFFFFHFSATPSGCEDHCALQVLEVPPPRLRLLAPVESSPHGKQILGHSNPSSITNLNQYVHYPLRRAMSVPSVPDSNQSWVS